jgi:hypothetical protein
LASSASSAECQSWVVKPGKGIGKTFGSIGTGAPPDKKVSV